MMGSLPQPICITKKYRQNTCPCWSSDGKKLAYSAMIKGVREIVIYDFLKKQEEQLTFGGLHKENPCWAPNNTHLVYNTVGSQESELFLIDIRQKKEHQVSYGPGRKHYPVWKTS